MTMTPQKQKEKKKQKKCQKCDAYWDLGTEVCGSCHTPFKPRTIQHHEIKRLLLDRYGTPRLNIRSNEVVMDGKNLTADEISWLYLELSSVEEKWTAQATIDAIFAMAHENRFDPVQLYLDGLKKQEVVGLSNEHWNNLEKCLFDIEDSTIGHFLKQYFIAAVARVYRPGLEARCSPVLVGAQHRGKTTMGKILFGESNWVEGISDLGKDAIMRCQMGWGVELSELDGVTRRSDVEALKTFLTATTDHYRKPYGKGTIAYARNFCFWGTSNSAPLRDLSGNSRFLCIPVPDKMLPLDWVIENRDALWARAIAEYENGFDWTTVTEEQREARACINTDYQQLDAWSEEIESLLNATPEGFIKLATIFEKMDIPKERRSSQHTLRIRQIVDSLGWGYGTRRLRGVTMRGFWKSESKEITPEEKDKMF